MEKKNVMASVIVYKQVKKLFEMCMLKAIWKTSMIVMCPSP